MKKLLLVLAIGAFVACNDASTSGEKPADSPATTQPAPDTTSTTPVDTTHTGVDTSAAKAVDTVKK